MNINVHLLQASTTMSLIQPTTRETFWDMLLITLDLPCTCEVAQPQAMGTSLLLQQFRKGEVNSTHDVNKNHSLRLLLDYVRRSNSWWAIQKKVISLSHNLREKISQDDASGMIWDHDRDMASCLGSFHLFFAANICCGIDQVQLCMGLICFCVFPHSFQTRSW